MLERLLQYVTERELIRAGDRVAVAVSGGADSAALLRLLLEARSELGIVLSVAHFNHRIRGAEADGDEAFVRALAAKYDLAFHLAAADTPHFARDHHLGLEAAARQLRHEFFRGLIQRDQANKVATAHTLDDQAETVLLRLMRGAGTKGLAGIYPELALEGGSIVRPLLNSRRGELRAYLQSLNQDWREDTTNSDPSFTRNRVRQRLLPVIEQEFGRSTLERLAETAEIARAEEGYWQERIEGLGRQFVEKPQGLLLKIDVVSAQPLAIRRRLIRSAAQRLGIALDFQHVEQVLSLTHLSPGSSAGPRTLALPNGLAVSVERGHLHFSTLVPEKKVADFLYKVAIPGEIAINELECRLRFLLVEGGYAVSSYDPGQRLRADLTGSELIIRNWRAGDRFWPWHSKSVKKVKELLKPSRVPAGQRALWPVVEHRGEILWVRGLPVSHRFCARDNDAAVVIEELSL